MAAGEFLEWLKIGAQRVYPARTGDSGRRHPGPGPPGDAGAGLFPRLLPGDELRDPAGPAPAPPLALRRRKTPGPGRNLSEPASLCRGTLPQSVGGRAPPHPDPAPSGGPGRTGKHPDIFGGVGPRPTWRCSTIPNPAWLRSPAIQAVFHAPEPAGLPEYPDPPLLLSLPGEISLSQVSTALRCPCRFLLENLLKIKELPEIEAGLDPRERGQLLHEVLARFTAAFKEMLEADQAWDHAARPGAAPGGRPPGAGPLELRSPLAGRSRPLAGGGRPAVGVAKHWNGSVLSRAGAGWAWRWPSTTSRAGTGLLPWRGRIDRLDYHPETCRPGGLGL